MKSIKFAPNDYTLIMAHLVNAQVSYLLTEYFEANNSFNTVGELLSKNPDYRVFPEVIEVVKEVEELFERKIK